MAKFYIEDERGRRCTYSVPQCKPRYPGLRNEELSKVEPPAIQIIRSPDRDWSESRLRDYAAGLRNTAQNRVLTDQQRRNCLEEAETAERYADAKHANAPAE